MPSWGVQCAVTHYTRVPRGWSIAPHPFPHPSFASILSFWGAGLKPFPLQGEAVLGAGPHGVGSLFEWGGCAQGFLAEQPLGLL